MSEPVHKSENEEIASPPGMPRWVKLLGLVILVVAVVVVAFMLLTGGEHGPGLHTSVSISTSSVI